MKPTALLSNSRRDGKTCIEPGSLHRVVKSISHITFPHRIPAVYSVLIPLEPRWSGIPAM